MLSLYVEVFAPQPNSLRATVGAIQGSPDSFPFACQRATQVSPLQFIRDAVSRLRMYLDQSWRI